MFAICQWFWNYWQIASLVTQTSLFTVTHALFFISCLTYLKYAWYVYMYPECHFISTIAGKWSFLCYAELTKCHYHYPAKLLTTSTRVRSYIDNKIFLHKKYKKPIMSKPIMSMGHYVDGLLFQWPDFSTSHRTNIAKHIININATILRGEKYL